jgi:hypothetical protein
MMRSVVLALLPVAALSLGCGGPPGPSVAMQDSFEITLFHAQEDLHTPYVVGAKFNITVATTGNTTTAGWTLSSSNPSVLSVGSSTDSTDFPVTAVAPGQTTLSVLDASKKVLDTHVVEVAEPDSVQLAAHGLLLAGLSDSEAQVSHASVLEGGTATFLVRYYQGARELYGNGAVTPTSSGPVTATTTASSFADDRDWIALNATNTAGSGQVALAVGGRTVTIVPVQVVASSTIARIGTIAQSESKASDGETLYVFGRAFDSQGVEVYGASYTWVAGGTTVSGVAGPQPSDLLSYNYSSSASETVTATYSTFLTSTTVHGTGGTVGSTTAVDCSVARGVVSGRSSAGAFVLVACAAGALAGRRRRRSAALSTSHGTHDIV